MEGFISGVFWDRAPCGLFLDFVDAFEALFNGGLGLDFNEALCFFFLTVVLGVW